MEYKEVGYQYILSELSIEGFNLESDYYIYNGNVRKKNLFPVKYWPGDSIYNHLEFIIKYDYINLTLLYSIFLNINKSELIKFVEDKKQGKYVRIIWFLYEFLTREKLDIEDLASGNYTDLLDNNKYFTSGKISKKSRQRLNNNFLGNDRFCPIIRKSKTLLELYKIDIKSKLNNITVNYNKSVLRRALTFLYNKETKSSFEIEHENADQNKIQRFIQLLSGAENKDFLNKENLVELQNSIVDPRFKDTDYRKTQNYVGLSIYPFNEIIHFISPKPEDIDDLMDGLLKIHSDLKLLENMEVIHAALLSYAFVFFHPFEDGNGRIHRFLIHNILAITGFTPKGVMFPISAVMLKNMDLYDDSLECFSKSILPLIEYTLSDVGEMEVTNDTKYLYKYMDLTSQVEYLYRFIIETIDGELIKELNFLTSYDICTKKIKEVVDLPNNKLSLLMKFLMQNDYKLSNNKREKYFSFLTNNEIKKIEDLSISIFNTVNNRT